MKKNIKIMLQPIMIYCRKVIAVNDEKDIVREYYVNIQTGKLLE